MTAQPGRPNPPNTEERLRACTLGDLAPYSQDVTILDYDPDWPIRFQAEADRVRAVLGSRVLSLEHVGSTSVPGLPAKPILDMALVVADAADEAAYVLDLERAGYVLHIREPDWYEHRLLKGPGVDINMHVFSAGCPEVARMRAFRDWLRANPGDRDLYAATKRELATRVWKYVQNYADAKAPIIEAIMARAGL
jgi:GrpB-like predicted nucleotidyltransferase (UPF0157 family)